MRYTCSECAEIVELNQQEVDYLDSGTVLICPRCQGKTIVDLWNPTARDRFYAAANRAASVLIKNDAACVS